MSPVAYDVAGGVATITLDDPDNKNALGVGLINGIHEGLTAALNDDEVRAILLTHTGHVFCAGANLKERSAPDADQQASAVGFDTVLTMLRTCPKPTVAKIAGHTMGGGLGLACSVDIALASTDARFGFTEVRLGVAPAIISVVCLPKMRRGEAMEAFLRGNRFSGERAAELGLIARAVDGNRPDAAVSEVLADLLRGGPNGLAAAKRLVNEVPGMSIDDAFAWTTRFSAELFAGDEAAEGMQAFLGKRDAAWVPSDD